MLIGADDAGRAQLTNQRGDDTRQVRIRPRTVDDARHAQVRRVMGATLTQLNLHSIILKLRA
ncbi:hypothetical protein D3C78_1410180 [compost metagenome]